VAVGDVLIDLGEVSPERATPRPGQPRPMPYRAVLGGLAVLLAALLTGAAHRGPPPAPVIVAARLGDMMFAGEDEVFVVSAGSEPPGSAVHDKIVSRYALPSGELVSRTPVTVSGAVFEVVAVGRVLLVSYQVDTAGAEATVALTEGSDRALWRQPSRMLAASARDGLVLLRENSPVAGDVTWAGIDLFSGAVRWSLRQPVRGFTTAAALADGFPRMLVTATTTGDLEVRDAVTGRITATARAPVRSQQAGADVPVWPTADLVLVGAPRGTTAYALPDLTQRWHSPVDLTGRWVQDACTTSICALSWQGGLVALDPATGRQRWSDPRWSYAEQIGPYLLATRNAATADEQAVSVLDPLTGRVEGSFGAWHAVGRAGPDGAVIGLREELADDTVWYARLDPATRAVRLLGRADQVSGDCQTTREVLICRRIDASVGIWPLK
jgi:hypothetical protein